MDRKLGVIGIDRITAVIQRRCESLGVNVKWDRSAPTASTNGKTIVLPVVKAPVTKSAMDKLYGFVIHEAGHHKRPDAFDILNSAQPSDSLCAMYNIMEDDGMEREVATEYKGDAIALGTQNNVVLKELVKAWKQGDMPEDLSEQQVAPISVCALGQLSRLEWDGLSTEAHAAFFNELHPVAKKLTDELVKEGWVDKMKQTTNPHETWDLAVDLHKRIYPPEDDDEEKAIEQTRQQGHAKQGPPKRGESDGGEDGTAGDEAGKPKQGDSKDGAKAKGGEGTVVSWKDAVLSEHNEWKPKKAGTPAGNIGIDWTDYTKGKVGLMPQKLVNVIDCRTDIVTTPERSDSHRGVGSPESFMPDNSTSRAFGNQVRRYMQAQARTRVDREKYHGRLDKGALVRLALPPIDGGEYNKRIFYDHTKMKQLNTCIMVLTDWSGSMNGQKMVHAADASGRLVYVFDRVLRCPVALAAFTNGESKCDIGLIKDFNDKVSPEQIATGFSRFYKYSSANNDADSVMWGYNKIIRRSEDRKVLIVLSDGCPAGSYAGSGSENLRQTAKQIEKEGKVELYGVGIKSDAVEDYYTNNKVLQDETEINRTLLEILKQGDRASGLKRKA